MPTIRGQKARSAEPGRVVIQPVLKKHPLVSDLGCNGEERQPHSWSSWSYSLVEEMDVNPIITQTDVDAAPARVHGAASAHTRAISPSWGPGKASQK